MIRTLGYCGWEGVQCVEVWKGAAGFLLYSYVENGSPGIVGRCRIVWGIKVTEFLLFDAFLTWGDARWGRRAA